MHDQFAALYGRYRVDSCLVQLDAIADPTTAHCITALLQGPSGNMGLGGKPVDQMIENVKAKNLFVLGTATSAQTIRFNVDIAEYLGIGRDAYEADLSVWGAAFGSNPTRTMFLNLATSAFAGTSHSIQVVVTLVFDVKLWDPLTYEQS